MYSNLQYGSTIDTKAERVNNFQRKVSQYDDAISEDFTRAPPALKNRSAISQRPAAGSLLSKAGSMQLGGGKAVPDPTLHSSSFKSQNPIVGFSEGELQR